MRFYFHEHAETEFDRVVEYYQDCQRGLGIEFAQEVNAAIARIIQYPDAWSQCPRALVAAWSIGFPLALYINSGLTISSSSQLPIFDVARAIGYTECEQNLLLHIDRKGSQPLPLIKYFQVLR